MNFAALLDRELADVRDMLIAKNTAYGNSALDPVRIFSQADTVEQIKVRLDDKLSRLARGQAAGEDVETDLLGYLFLLRIARRIAADNLNAVTSAVSPAFTIGFEGLIGADVALNAKLRNDQSRVERDAAFPSPSQEVADVHARKAQ